MFPLIFGHRGNSAIHPENTFASLTSVGSSHIETDLHYTKDGEIILLHDDTLERTTNSSGNVSTRNWKGDLEFVRTKRGGLPLILLQHILKHLETEGASSTKICLDVKVNQASIHGSQCRRSAV